ncbi:MAG: helix-turn-helix transcriptional regulator [Ruminococcaceae bacterium]|nr:helix-turn-helix transcriptional regulator [Oscillospiraceae bacterium]
MREIDYKALGERIRAARRAKNMTQETLGEICSLSAAHIGHIERGTRIPSLDTLYKISLALSVSVDHLLFDSACTVDAVFASVSASLKGKDEAKVRSFISTVKALWDKIDDL